MSVNQTIDDNLVTQFSDFVHNRAQQMNARLKNAGIRMKPMTGDNFAYDGLGQVEMTEVTSRVTPADFQEIEHNRREITRRRFYVNLPIDASDVRGTLISQRETYGMAVVNAAARQFDRIGIEAAFADVKTGRLFGTTVDFSTDGGFDVDATAGYTYEKLLEIKENFMNVEVGLDADENIIILQTGTEHTSLMQEIELISGDFSRQIPIDKNGEISIALGMKLIHYGANTPNPQLSTTAGGVRSNIAMSTRALCYGISKNIELKIQERNDFIETTQVQAVLELGAVRTEGILMQELRTTA